MRISFNLILDWLRDCSVYHSLEDTGRTFTRPSILPENIRNLDPDLLYVCNLTDTQSALTYNPDAVFICPYPQASVISSGTDPNIILTDYPGGQKDLLLFLENHFFKTGDWYSHMQEMIIRNAGLQELITSSEPVIGNTIDVSDSAFTLLASTYGIPTDHELTLQLRKFGYHTEASMQLMKKHDRFAAYESAGDDPLIFDCEPDFGMYKQVNRIFRFQNVYFTHVVMICDHYPLTKGMLELFGMLCEFLGIYFKREWDKRNIETNNCELFIKSIIDGSLHDFNEIDRRSAYFGLPPNGKYELTAILTENDIGVYKTRFLREISELLPASEVLTFQELFLILTPVSSSDARKSSTLSDHLENFLNRNMASAGSSGIFTGLKMLPLAYKRASLALKYSPSMCRGRAYITPPGEPIPPAICSFADCFSRCIAGESADGEILWRNSRAGQALLTLYANDAAHNNNNLPLLYTYLLSGLSASRTAEIFHMHRNNVPYRLNRISSIIGMDLGDEKVRSDLFVSFLLFDIYGP